MKSLLALLLLSIVVNINAQIYFILEEGQVRCFLEEVPKDTLVIGRYRTEEEGTGMARSGIKVTVTDPEGNIAMQRDMNPSGRFAFTSAQEGEFKLCFQTNSSRWFGARQRIKFYLDMETGEQATDYEEIAQQEHLTNLEVSVRRLSDRIRDIRAEQNYQRNREAVFRNTSESTNSRVMWWSIIQTMILVGTGAWQITHLKKFFKAKKLV